MSKASVSTQLSDDEKQKYLREGKPLQFSNRKETESSIERANRTIRAEWLESLVANGTVQIPIEIKNAVIEGPLRLKQTTFERAVRITDSEFTREVDFTEADFKHSASFARSCFQGEAKFNGASIQGPGDFRAAQFFGAASFLGIEFKGQAVFLTSQFHAAVNFNDAHFLTVVTFASSQFQNNSNFSRIHAESQIVFSPELTPGQVGQPVIFGGVTSFFAAHIEGTADFRSAQFRSDARFDNIHFGSIVHFEPYDDDSPHTSFNREASFSAAILDSEAFFLKTDFLGDAVFQYAHFKATADFAEARFKGNADFTSAKSDSEVRFVKSTFSGDAIFIDSSLSILSFRSTLSQQPLGEVQFCGRVRLSGWTGKKMLVAWGELEGRVERDDLIRIFLQLEASMRAEGNEREADKIYFDRREAERHEARAKKDWGRWALGTLYRCVAGYGVRPYRLFVLLLFFLAIGTVIFQLPGAVTHQEASLRIGDPYQLTWLEALSVSVNQILLGGIPWGSKWKPSENPIPLIPILPFTFYATIHRLASSLLLAILVAFIRDLLHLKRGV